MELLVHILIFLASIVIVWFFAGVLIESVQGIARRYCRSGFLTAFFLLGLLTSVSEMSVAANAALERVPGVSVGNLIGASFVILLFIIPFLAFAGRGVSISRALSWKTLTLMLGTIALPALMVLDGNVTRTEGLLVVLAYGTVAYALYRQQEHIRACDPLEEDVFVRTRRLAADLGRIILCGIAIFAAAHFLVEQAVYFAGALSVPPSLIGLLLLSIGTNIPELVIAVRAVLAGRSDIALGDYLGSSSMNSLVFGLLALGAGPFAVEAGEFMLAAALFIPGLILLFVFARSGRRISRGEGVVLFLFYAALMLSQAVVALGLVG